MTERLTPSDLASLHARGLTDETIERAGLYSATSPEGADIVARPATALTDFSGIAIPNHWPGEDTRRQIRLRRNNPDIEEKPDGSRKERDKYMTAVTTPNRFYIPPGTPVEWLSDASIPAVFVEGEFKGLRTYQAQRSAGRKCLVIALTGVWSWRGKVGKEPSQNGGSHSVYGIISDFQRITWQALVRVATGAYDSTRERQQGRAVTICFDAITGKEKCDRSVRQARTALADTLAHLGAAVKVATVPKEDKAIDDYFNAHGDKAGLDLLDSATTGERRNIFHADERKAHIQPAEAVIEGVAYRRQVTVFEGAAGGGKSHVVTDLAATAAQVFKVLFITNESPEELDARLDAWEAFHRRDLAGLHILPEVAGLFDLTRISALIESMKAWGGFDLVCHDILSNEFEGRKEDNENMAVAFAAAYQITRACDCAYILTAHTGWSGEHIRGGSQAYGSARRVFQVENSDEVLTVKVKKANVSRGLEARQFRILQIPLERIPNADPKRAEEYTVLMPAESVIIDAGPLSDRQLQILRFLALPVFATAGAYPKDIGEHTKISKSTINNATSVLITRGFVEDVPHKAGMVKASDAGWSYLHALGDGQKSSKKPTEQGTNTGSLNWVIPFGAAPKINPLVREGSYPVRSEFGQPGSEFVRTLPSIEGTTTEQAELELEAEPLEDRPNSEPDLTGAEGEPQAWALSSEPEPEPRAIEPRGERARV